MSQRQDKRIRREVSKYLRDAGATPEQIAKNWKLTVKPKPWWLPARLWDLLIWFVLQPPHGRRIKDGQYQEVER